MSNWISYALATVFFWGIYGVLIHTGRGFMPGLDTAIGNRDAGIKAFFWVGMAYFVVAVVGPIVVLKMRQGATFNFTTLGITWSFIAGVAGALGALYLVLSLGEAASPKGGNMGASAAAAVMPIVFGLAPIVNTITAMLKHPPEGGMKSIDMKFFIGCLLAAIGAFMVSKYSPSNKGAAKPAAAATTAAPPAAH